MMADRMWWAVVIVGVLAFKITDALVSNPRPIIGVLAQEFRSDLEHRSMPMLQQRTSTLTLTESTTPFVRENPSGLWGDPSLLKEYLDLGDDSFLLKEHLGLKGDSPPRKEGRDGSPVPSTNPTNASYIAASYVKFLEAAGARVVPIMINQNQEYYEHIVQSINGVLFPGGGVAIDNTSGYGRAGRILYDLAVSANTQGEVFPLWGTCLGFELMLSLAGGGQEIRAHCDAQNVPESLTLDKEYASGLLFRHLSKAALRAVTTQPITANFHHFCITPENFTKFSVDRVFRPLAYSRDKTGLEYLAVAEGKNLPFYAVQFHPEKSQFEWTQVPMHNNIPHDRYAIAIATHFSQFFVNQARRSNHHFLNATEEAAALIYNFSPVFYGVDSIFLQIYVF